MGRWWRERRVLTRVTRAAWRLEQAERERTWALASARAEGLSIRKLAAAVGLSPSRVHQIVSDADLDDLDIALGELRLSGWPAPEDPDCDHDELGGRAQIADRLDDEVTWLRTCAGWIAQIDAGGYPPALNLRPSGDRPQVHVAVNLARVRRVIDRIADDVAELARARRVDDLEGASIRPDRCAEQRRRAAEPDLGFQAFCDARKLRSSSTEQMARHWDTWQDERVRRGEIEQRPDNALGRRGPRS